MKKLIILTVLTMSCQTVKEATLIHARIRRCENEETICYITEKAHGTGITCKDKQK